MLDTAIEMNQAVSPLMLADRMLTLAKEADVAGYVGTADRLVRLAFRVWDQQPRPV